MTLPWWAAFGPAEAQVSCGGGTHKLRWADGTLKAVDHPDAEGELVLAALGGEASPCLDLVMAWGRHSDDLTVLAIGPRSPEDKLTVTPSVADELTAGPRVTGWLAYGTGTRARPPRPRPATAHLLGRGFAGGRLRREDDPSRTELINLLALGPSFQQRLSGAVAHAWSADGPHAERQSRARPALTAALAGRLAPAAARWLDIDPGQVEASIRDRPGSGELDRAGWGEVSLARSAGERRLLACLPVGWLARVWAPGLTLIGGHLVVSVLEAAWPDARVLALRSPGRDSVELSIRHDQGHWSVAAR